MSPPAASPPPDISFTCTNEELFASLERIMSGFPPPTNVITDVNPYLYMPSNLPDGVWYLVQSKENTNAQHGSWKAKGEASEVFSNSVIIGWRTTLEFYEGQVPHEHKTNWVMQDFRITHKRLCESRKSDDSSSLCRVFLSAEQNSNNENQHNMFTADTASEASVQLALLDIVKALSERPANNDVAYPPDGGCISREDYLELDDLDEPLSLASSSVSSSRTMSSDEYFDPAALLKELEPKNNEDKRQDDAGYKYIVSASHRPTEVVVLPPSLGSVERRNSPAEEIHKPNGSMPASTIAKGSVDDKPLKQANAGQKAESTNRHAHNVASSSNSRSAVRNGKKKKVGRVKKLKKYLCFMA